MSLVGPRPLMSDGYEIHEIRVRFGVYNVCSGVTGLAQINGRDTVPLAQKVRWDAHHPERFGLWMDSRNLIATMLKIFGEVGVMEGVDGMSARKEEKGD